MGKKKSVRDTSVEAACRKNDEVVIEITDMGTEGEGVGRVNGYTLFVKGALPGDCIRARVMKVRKHFGYARLLEILTPSPDRVEPICPVAQRCGGCQLQHLAYEKQLRWKEETVYNCLKRIGGFTDIPMEPIMGMDKPYHYRNKAQFPLGTDKQGNPVAGFYASRTHDIVENTDCSIQHPCTQAIVETVLQFMREYRISVYDEKEHKGLVRHILTRIGIRTGQIMVCLVLNGKKLPYAEILIQRLTALFLSPDVFEEEKRTATEWKITSICLDRNEKKTNVILGGEISVLYGRPYIEDFIGNMKYRISPLSFYQVNPLQTERLYQTALDFADLQGKEIVWDLYCGIGTISLFLAQKAEKVFGVEVIPQAIADAKQNAKLNHLDNVEFFVGAAEDVVVEQYQKSSGSLRADVVTLDPPRKGCDEKLLQTVVKMQPDRIVYVSCNPATLARDLQYLCRQGYQVKRVRACDMFGMAVHVESVCLLHRKDS